MTASQSIESSPSQGLANALANSPPYWDQACKQLVKKDRVMRRLIPALGATALGCNGNAFVTLARSIVAQQISPADAKCLWKQLLQCLPPDCDMTPETLLTLQVDGLRAVGLSARKADYLLMHPGQWATMDDGSVTTELLAIRGVSRRVAELFLIFHLGRPNVLPLDDAALLRGISQYYFSGEPVSRSEAREVAHAWKPWCSVASWYIWQSLDHVANAAESFA